MRIENPVRLGGLAALLAGVLLLISEVLSILPFDFLPFGLSGDELAIYGFLGINGYLGVLLVALVQLGLVALYASQAKAAGALALVGVFIAFFGGRLVLRPLFVDPIAKPYTEAPGGEPSGLWWVLVIYALVFVLGWILFGVATLRSGAYPRAAVALLIVGTLILFLPLPLSSVIFAVAVAWMGYVLFTARAGEGREDITMRIENPVRWGGLAAFLAGGLFLISELLNLYLSYFDPGAFLSFLPLDPWLGVLLVVLVQLGLVGLYASQAKAAGALGAVGLFLVFIGVWLAMGGSFVSPISLQSAWPDMGEPEEFVGPLALFGLTFVLGWILFGAATLRANIYPRAAAVLLIAGVLILLLPLPLSNVIFSVAVAWMGYFLFAGGSQEEAVHRRT